MPRRGSVAVRSSCLDLRADTVGRMTITDKADFKAKVRASMCQLQNDPEKIRTKNYRSNMPPESAFTYGLINNIHSRWDCEQQTNPNSAVDALAGRPCWLAVDMSSTTDLTAVVACFRDDEDGYIVAPWFFVPADNLQKRADADGVPYPRWAKEGHITATPGNAIDYRAVEACIRDACSRFDVREIAFDKAYAQAVMGPLLDDGFPVVTMQQGWVPRAQRAGTRDRLAQAASWRAPCPEMVLRKRRHSHRQRWQSHNAQGQEPRSYRRRGRLLDGRLARCGR